MTKSEYIKEWYKRNPTKRAEYARNSRRTNGEAIRAMARSKRKTRGDHVRKNEKSSREASPENFITWRWSQTKSKHHGKSGLKYTKAVNASYLISLWHKQNGLCAITNKQMLHVGSSLATISVDRIDSSLGYIEGNIQLVCKAINLAKGIHTNEEMRAFWQITSTSQIAPSQSPTLPN